MIQKKPPCDRLATDTRKIPLSPQFTWLRLLPLKTRFIINPRSGRAQRNLPAITAFAARHGFETTFTEHRGHAHELARDALAEDCTRIVAVGGDGTMNEVGRALIGSTATLALVPCGSGDGLGRHLGIHGSVERALSLLELGQVRVIDTGTADGHPFFNVAGLGLEADLAQRFHTARVRGLAGYVFHGLASLRHSRPVRLRITGDDRETDFRAATLAIANGDQYGNHARIAPTASCDDGKLELTALPALSWRNLPTLARRLFDGTLDQDTQVLRLQGRSFVVQRETAGWIHTDGETHLAPATVRFSIIPASLRILCPTPVGR